MDPGYSVLCGQTILTRLKLQYEEMKKQVLQSLAKVHSVSLTIDEWSSRAQDSYISLEAQYLDDNFNMHHVTLCNEALDGRPNAINIAASVNDAINEWKLMGKVVAIVHDSASVMHAAVTHVQGLPISINCNARMLQLVVKDAMAAVPKYDEIITKGRALVMHFRKSNLASNALSQKQRQLELKEKRLKQSCETRWDSKFDMCEALLVNRRAIALALADRSQTTSAVAQKLEITEAEWSTMEDMVKILQPFQVKKIIEAATPTDREEGDEEKTPKPTALDFLFNKERQEENGKKQLDMYISEPEIGHNLEPLLWWKTHV